MASDGGAGAAGQEFRLILTADYSFSQDRKIKMSVAWCLPAALKARALWCVQLDSLSCIQSDPGPFDYQTKCYS